MCYADLRPLPPPAREDLGPAEAGLDLLATPASLGAASWPAESAWSPPGWAAPLPSWPCSTCWAPNPLPAASCTACGAGFLAELHEQQRLSVAVPVVGDLLSLSKRRLFGLALAAAGAVSVVLLVVVTLLGLLF